MIVTGNRRIMGEYANGRLAKTMGWAPTGLMITAAGAYFSTGGGI